MTTYGKWQTVRELGQGGQGRVYLVFDAKTATIPLFGFQKWNRLLETIGDLAADARRARPDSLDKETPIPPDFIAPILSLVSQIHVGALKVLQSSESARDPKQVKERMRNELEAYQRVDHPNLLQVIDHCSEEYWFVTEYHANGTLDKHRARFRGRVSRVLRALRDLVEGVAILHKADIVHRDIKPENIFLSSEGQLILGDMGLAFFMDEEGSRQTGSFSNVGTRAWMPPWAMNVRVEKVRPSFDVYALGKVLWSMVTGNPALPVTFQMGSIRSAFGDSPDAALIEDLIHQCVAGTEQDCLPDGAALLAAIDDVLFEINSGYNGRYVKMAAHAMKRSGGLHLLSIDAPTQANEPSSTGMVVWRSGHPSLKGKAFDQAVWADFLEFSPEHGRYLIRPPLPRSFDSELDIEFSKGIRLSDAKYLHLAIAVDPTVQFSIYLKLMPGPRWIAFNPTKKSIEKVGSNEYVVPAPRLKGTERIEEVVLDVGQAYASTWRGDEQSMDLIQGLRFRGQFKMLFVRIV